MAHSASTSSPTRALVRTRRQRAEMDADADAIAASRFEIQLDQAVLTTLDASLANRPKNTNRNYVPKQQEFLSWCAKQACDPMTRDKVTGKKLHLFLREEVIGRAVRSHPAKKRRLDDPVGQGGDKGPGVASAAEDGNGDPTDDDEDDEEDGEADSGGAAQGKKTIGWSTVKGYVTAVTDLWQQQQLRGVNSDPNPRQGAVGQLLAVEQLKENERKRTHMDGYSREQMRAAVDHFITRNSDASLRDCVCFLLSHFALLRGDDLRPIELADIHHLEMRNEGLSDCFAIMLLLRHGKTNKHGRVEFGSFIRNKDANICPVGFLAMYLFSRFHITGLPAPDFTSSDRWYPLKLFRATKGGSTTKAIIYNTQLDAIDDAFKAAGIVGSAKTHLARRSGAQMAELGGAEEGQVRRAGRWNSKVMESCYLSAIPREVLRVHAGFSREGGSYFLTRDVDVREELLTKVFPWADDWDSAISSGKTANGTRVEVNIAARGFIRLLLRLRKVIVQDAVVLRKSFPKWFVWSHSLFSDPLFLQYERDLLASLDSPAPSDDRIAQVLPLLAEQIASSTAAMQQAMAAGFVAVGAQVASFSQQQNLVFAEQRKYHDTQMQALHQHVNALSGMFMGALSALSPASTSTPRAAAHGLTSSSAAVEATHLSSSDTAHPSSHSITSPAPHSTILPITLQPQRTASPGAHMGPPAVPPVGAIGRAAGDEDVERGQEQMPAFEQDRNIASVGQLWAEWEYGMGGRPSVAEMDSRWGNKWRTKDTHRKHYARRINIITKIKSLATERHTSCEVIAQQLDSARTDEKGKQISLFQLNEQLKTGAVVITAA